MARDVPVLLLHGYPETGAMWHAIAPALARQHTVVVPDLRGYGASGRPPSDDTHRAYSKRAMAADQAGLMRQLGHATYAVVGHDRGARVAHRLVLDHPDAVDRVALLDIAPTRHVFGDVDKVLALSYDHWFFLAQENDLPEVLIGGAAEHWLRTKLDQWSGDGASFDEKAVAEYVRSSTPRRSTRRPRTTAPGRPSTSSTTTRAGRRATGSAARPWSCGVPKGWSAAGTTRSASGGSTPRPTPWCRGWPSLAGTSCPRSHRTGRWPRSRASSPSASARLRAMTHRWTAQELLDLVLDEGSYESWDEPIDISDAPPDYRAALEAAREKAGTDESVLTGRGLVHGRPVAVLVNEFRFLAGSIGLAAARRITSAIRRATAEGIPVLATTASGGTRMQEGTPAFVQMVEISRAVMEHRAAGLPYLVYLRHPTTGGVYASWGSLAHVTVAEPGALVGFLGPKVFEALNGEPFPEGVQVAENLANHGVIDGVATAEELPALVDSVLAVLVDPPSEPRLVRRTGDLDPDRDAWASIQETRGDERIGVREVLRRGADVVLPLSGTEKGERDSTVLVVLARLDGEPCLLVGQDRSRQGPSTPLGPGALRTARRAMRLANEIGLPFVSVIDTPGASCRAVPRRGRSPARSRGAWPASRP